MVKVNHFICSFAIIAMVAFVASCGGSSGTAATGGSGDSGTTVAGGADDTSSSSSLKSVDAISVDMSMLDLSQSSTQTSLSAGTGKNLSKDVSVSKGMGSTVGDDSFAGCQLNQMKGEAIRQSKEIKIFQCYLAMMQDNLTDFTVPINNYAAIAAGATPTYAYYSFTVPAEEGETPGPSGEAMSMKLRVAKNAHASNSMEVQLCQNGESQSQSLVTTADSATNTFVVDAKNHFSFTPPTVEEGGFDKNGDGEVSDAEKAGAKLIGVFDEWMSIVGTIIGKASATGSLDDISKISSASMTASFDGNWGVGNMSLKYGETGAALGSLLGVDTWSAIATPINAVGGYFKGQNGASTDTNEGGMYGEFNTAEGTAKFSASGSMPAIPGSFFSGMSTIVTEGINASASYCPVSGCQYDEKAATDPDCSINPPPMPPKWPLKCFCLVASASGSCTFSDGGTEHFSVSADDSDADSDPEYKIAETSIFADTVADFTLATGLISLAKTSAFWGDYAWDCTAPSGSSFVTLDVTSLIAAGKDSACVAAEAEAFGKQSQDSCFEKQGGDNASEATGGGSPSEFD